MMLRDPHLLGKLKGKGNLNSVQCTCFGPVQSFFMHWPVPRHMAAAPESSTLAGGITTCVSTGLNCERNCAAGWTKRVSEEPCRELSPLHPRTVHRQCAGCKKALKATADRGQCEAVGHLQHHEAHGVNENFGLGLFGQIPGVTSLSTLPCSSPTQILRHPPFASTITQNAKIEQHFVWVMVVRCGE